MPSVPVRMPVDMKAAIDDIRAAKKGSWSWHVIAAIKEWDALPEEEKIYEPLPVADLKQYQVSYQSQEIAMMDKYKKSPVPIAVVVRTACARYIKKMQKEIEAVD